MVHSVSEDAFVAKMLVTKVMMWFSLENQYNKNNLVIFLLYNLHNHFEIKAKVNNPVKCEVQAIISFLTNKML